jgi:predicted transcriptional regulator
VDFNQRLNITKKITSYLNSDNCSIENLIGLKVVIQALDVAIDKKLQTLVKYKDNLNSKIKHNDESNWLD